MTACVQNLPSLVIPTSPRIPKFYIRKPSSNVQETKEDFAVTVKHFQKKFPTLASLYTNDNYNTRKLSDHPNLWSYGTPYLVKLLFTGNLPKSFFEEILEACETTKTKRKKRLCNNDNGEEEDTETKEKTQEREIWLPKDKIKIRESGRRVEQRILEARLRHKENLENLSMRAEQFRSRTEVIRLRKAGEMERGKKACLEKMQKAQIRPGRLIKRPSLNTKYLQPSRKKVFELTEPLQVC